MSWLTAIQQAFGIAWRYKRAILVCYALVAAWAFFVAYPLHHLFEETVGNSLLVADMVKGFDYTLLNDFKNNYGDGLTPIFDQSILMLVLSFLSLIFATGGLLALVVERPERYMPSFFWGNSVNFFWRLLRLTVYFGLIHAAILGLFLLLFYTSSNGLSPFSLENEAVIATNFLWVAPLYVLVAAFFFLWQEYTKLYLVEHNNRWIFQALWPALKFVLRHPSTYGLYLLNGLLWLLLVLGNYYLYKAVAVNTVTTILLSLLISQVFILLRFTLKVVVLGSLQAWRVKRLVVAK